VLRQQPQRRPPPDIAAPNNLPTDTDRKFRDRRSIRLPYYDYAQGGGYFITICTDRRQMFFQDPKIANLVRVAWGDIPNHHPQVQIDEFVVMPNHVHGILILAAGDERAVSPAQRGQQAAPLQGSTPNVAPGSLSAVVRSFKARVTRDLRAASPRIGVVWQRNYYEHVIRNEAGLQRIRQYIYDNPARWSADKENPAATIDRYESDFEEWLGSRSVTMLR
jgi:REP element-mobilizing transposase RayT